MPNNLESKKYLENCKSLLREKGLRVTKPRLAVLQCLQESIEPLTASDLYEQLQTSLKKKNISVDKVSIYRTLEMLNDLGLIHQVFPSGGYMPCFHRKCSSKFHILLHCTNCKETEEVDISENSLNNLFSYLATDFNFSVTGKIFQLDGICGKCNSK